jgi:predicted RNA-binding Zn-ribbon protein involved in translation (DUF1610 family)
MSTRLYRLYCEYCNWNLVTDGTDKAAKCLKEMVVAEVPGGSPKIDPETKKIVLPKSKKPKKKFKCPKCGRGITPRIIKEANAEETNTA